MLRAAEKKVLTVAHYFNTVLYLDMKQAWKKESERERKTQIDR